MFGRQSTWKHRLLAGLVTTLTGLLALPVRGELPGSIHITQAETEIGRTRLVDDSPEGRASVDGQLPVFAPATTSTRTAIHSTSTVPQRSVAVSGSATTIIVAPAKSPARQSASASLNVTIIAPQPPPLPEIPLPPVESVDFAAESDSQTGRATLSVPPSSIVETTADDVSIPSQGVAPSSVEDASEAQPFPMLTPPAEELPGALPAPTSSASGSRDDLPGGTGNDGPAFDFASSVQQVSPLPPSTGTEPATQQVDEETTHTETGAVPALLRADSESSSTELLGASSVGAQKPEVAIRAAETPPLQGPIAFFDDASQSVPTPADPTDLPASEPVSSGQLSNPDDVINRDTPASSSSTAKDDQTLGEKPESNTLRFLRQQTVLLDPCEFQFDVGFQYLNDEIDFSALSIDNGNAFVGEVIRRQRLLMVPLEMRVGLTKYMQGFVRVPFGWSNSEISFNGQDDFEDTGILGDVSAGLTKQIIVGNEFYPDVLWTTAFSAPTGDASVATSLLAPGSALGLGFWTISTNLTFIQNYDPLVIFYGLGYTARFKEKFGDNLYVDPGDMLTYRFGAGFAVNPNVTLSTTFFGSYIGRSEINDLEVGGSIQEPMQLRLAATISRRKPSDTHSSVKIIEPFVNFGLNEDAVDVLFGVTFTR